jgi:hypothetical protein
MDFLRSLSAKHTELKKKIHAFRIPLSPAKAKMMAYVYFSVGLCFAAVMSNVSTFFCIVNNS